MTDKKITPDIIRQTREKAGLTVTQAASLVNKNYNGWWVYEAGKRSMPANVWELFLMKIGVDSE